VFASRFHILTRFGYVSAACLCLALWCGLVVERYRGGQNFVPVHVKLSGLHDAEDDVAVYVQSVHGSIGTLVRNEVDPLLWDHSYSISSVKRIIVAAQTLEDLNGVTVEVRVGQSWVEPSTMLRVLTGPVPAEVIPPGQVFAVQFLTEPFHKSRIASVRDAVNWSGDFWLFAVPLLQLTCLLTGVAVLVMTFRSLCRLNGLDQGHSKCDSRGMYGKAGSYILSATWLSASLLLMHQVWWHLVNFKQIIYVDQFCGLIAATVVCVVCISGYCYTILKIRREWHAALVAIFLIGVIKAVWVARIETIQFSDYGIYWDFGRRMALGEWASLESATDSLRTLLVERSYMYFYFVARWFGHSQSVLEVCNVVTQILTASLLYIFVRSILGHRIAVLSLPLFVIHPDFWFAATVASHDTPGFLWLSCTFVAFEFGRQLIEKFDAKTPATVACVLVVGILIGVVTGFLNLQRGFGPMVTLSLLLAVPCLLLTSRERRLQTGVLFLLMVVCSIVSAQQTCNLVRSCLEERVGEMGSFSTLGYVTAVETRTNAGCDEMQPWRFLYYPAVPKSERTSLSLRKLWYEKVATGSSFLRHVLRKNEIIGSAGGVVTFAYGGRADSFDPDTRGITWNALKYSFSSVCELMLKSLFILRLLSLPMIPPSRGEIFPLVFSLVMMASLLLLAETNATYDAFLAFPMAWSGGVVLDRVFCRRGEQRTECAIRSVSQLWRWSKPGIVLLVVLFTTQASLAVLTKRIGYTFFQPEHLECRYEGDRSNVQPVLKTSDVSVSMTYPVSGRGTTIPAGERIAGTFQLRGFTGSGRKVRLFLSGNQRLEKVVRPTTVWDDVPVTYTVFLNSQLISSGQVAGLQQPIWLEVPVQESPRPNEWQLMLESTKSWSSPSQRHAPAISIEYVYW
jgi:hypothetical protein